MYRHLQGPWTTDEDQLLKNLFNEHGPAWAVIALEIETRSADRKFQPDSVREPQYTIVDDI